MWTFTYSRGIMAFPTNGVFGRLRVLRIPENLVWKTPKEFIHLLVQLVVCEFSGGENDRTVVFGWQPPTADDYEKPWFRTDRQGTFMGWYYRSRNDWRKAVEVGTIDDLLGDANTPPAGWTTLDGSNGMPDTHSLWKGAAPNQLYKAIFTGYLG